MSTFRQLASSALLLILLPAFPSGAGAATLEVCPSGCAYDRIQSAIDAAVTGDEVLVDDGTYRQPIAFSGKAITVRSVNGAERTVIDADAGGPAVRFESGEGSDSVLEGFTLTNGAGSGGVWINLASPTIRDCSIVANKSGTFGGGINSFSGSPRIVRCYIFGNQGAFGGGFCAFQGAPQVEECTIVDNRADGGGYGGGGIFFDGVTSSTVISRSLITGNVAGNALNSGVGGGIFARNSNFTIDRCTITGNVGRDAGGGIAVGAGSAVITFTTIRANRSTAGGGIGAESMTSLSVQDCLIENNVAAQVSGSSSTEMGGGVYLDGCSLTDIERTVIRGNSSARDGGGLFVTDTPAVLQNCIIAGNRATGSTSGGAGGGILWAGAPTPGTIRNCTVAGNRALSGGGLHHSGGPIPAVENSILWGNEGGADPQILITSGTASATLVSCDVQGGWTGPGSGNIDADPVFLLPVAAASAPTAAGDYRIQSGSPCKNAASSASAPAADFEGDPRPQPPAYDIGADEAGLLANGYLEGAPGNRPAGWTASGLGAADKLVSDISHDGATSMRIAGSAAADKRLSQSRAGFGKRGRSFLVRGWSRAANPAKLGGAYGIEFRFTFGDRTTRSFWLNFARTTHDWAFLSRTVTAPRNFTRYDVVLHYDRQRGTAWFDGVEVLQMP